MNYLPSFFYNVDIFPYYIIIMPFLGFISATLFLCFYLKSEMRKKEPHSFLWAGACDKPRSEHDIIKIKSFCDELCGKWAVLSTVLLLVTAILFLFQIKFSANSLSYIHRDEYFFKFFGTSMALLSISLLALSIFILIKVNERFSFYDEEFSFIEYNQLGDNFINSAKEDEFVSDYLRNVVSLGRKLTKSELGFLNKRLAESRSKKIMLLLADDNEKAEID